MFSKLVFATTLALVLVLVHGVVNVRYSWSKIDGYPAKIASATIRRNDLDRGTDAPRNIRKLIGAEDGEDAGHMIAKRLGGPGVVDNMFRQGKSFNRGSFRVHEGRVYDYVKSPAYNRAEVTVSLLYLPSYGRPLTVYYDVTLVDNSGRRRRLEREVFPNM